MSSICKNAAGRGVDTASFIHRGVSKKSTKKTYDRATWRERSRTSRHSDSFSWTRALLPSPGWQTGVEKAKRGDAQGSEPQITVIASRERAERPFRPTSSSSSSSSATTRGREGRGEMAEGKREKENKKKRGREKSGAEKLREQHFLAFDWEA